MIFYEKSNKITVSHRYAVHTAVFVFSLRFLAPDQVRLQTLRTVFGSSFTSSVHLTTFSFFASPLYAPRFSQTESEEFPLARLSDFLVVTPIQMQSRLVLCRLLLIGRFICCSFTLSVSANFILLKSNSRHNVLLEIRDNFYFFVETRFC